MSEYIAIMIIDYVTGMTIVWIHCSLLSLYKMHIHTTRYTIIISNICNIRHFG